MRTAHDAEVEAQAGELLDQPPYPSRRHPPIGHTAVPSVAGLAARRRPRRESAPIVAIFSARARSGIEDALRRASGRLNARRGAIGDPAAEILRIAEKTGADIVVVGRRRSHTPHLLGPLSTKLVRAATCDVLVVHPGDRPDS